MKKYIIYIAILIIGLILGYVFFGRSVEGSANTKNVSDMTENSTLKNQMWTCSMHPSNIEFIVFDSFILNLLDSSMSDWTYSICIDFIHVLSNVFDLYWAFSTYSIHTVIAAFIQAVVPGTQGPGPGTQTNYKSV